jgi:hypothetical protein
MGNIKGVIVLITLIGLVSTMLVIAEKKTRKRYNYTIQTESGSYKTNAYQRADSSSTCIEFKNLCGCGGARGSLVTVCGNYLIIKNK